MTDSTYCEADVAFEISRIGCDEVGEFVALEMGPQPLVRVQVWAVGRQAMSLKPGMTGDESTSGGCPMGPNAVPNDNDRPATNVA